MLGKLPCRFLHFCVSKITLEQRKKNFEKKLRKILTLRKILGLRNISRYPSTGTLRAIQPSGNAVAGTAHAGRLLLREVIYRCLKGRKALQEYIITA